MASGNKVSLSFSWLDWFTVGLTGMGVLANAGFTILGILSRYEFRPLAGLLGLLIALAFVGFYLIVFSFLLNNNNNFWQKLLVGLFGWGITFSLDFYASLLGTVAVEKLANISSTDWLFRWLIALFVTTCGSAVGFYITQKVTNSLSVS
jgi:hypothetical protein